MTLYLLDVASYQGDLSPDDVARAGFGVVNLKISHGLGTRSVHPDITGWVARARALGLEISTFHYLTADAPGDAQAVHAYQVLAELGLLSGTAHQLDVECDPAPTLPQVRAYLTTMTALLGRPVALYTGDWWWAARPGWDVHDLAPLLWAAPNAGYQPAYPGDTSGHWAAGYGGWPQLAVMQYAVAPLSFPDGSVGSIRVSKSAIRDPAVWAALTGGSVATSQNGWAVDATGARQDRDPIHGTVTVPNGILRGDVATVLRWVASRYHDTVEPLVKGSCWGWYVKDIEGSHVISNHASGTAVDFNAPAHPMGTSAQRNMTPAQIDACHEIEQASGGVVRWGGDFSRPDPMHWEVVGTPAATAALATKIRTEQQQEDDVLTPEDKTWITGQLAPLKSTDVAVNPLAKILIPDFNQPAATRRKLPLSTWMGYTDANRAADKTAVIGAITQAVAALPQVDTAELVAGLAPALTAAIVAALPDDRDDITPAELQEAILGALKVLVAPATPQV